MFFRKATDLFYSQQHVTAETLTLRLRILQAKPFPFAATNNGIGRGHHCRYDRSRRAILYRHDDCAASIPKSGLEIKNRCMKDGVIGEKFASIRKSGPEIKNRCTKDGGNRENP